MRAFKHIMMVLLAFCILAGIGVAITLHNETPEQKAEREAEYAKHADRKEDARRACEQTIRGGLKAPSTASFGGDYHFTSVGDGPYEIFLYVDSQNGFGAMLRTHFACTTELQGKQWTISKLVRTK